MCRGTTFPAWQARCVEALVGSGSAVPALLLVEDRSGAVAEPRGAAGHPSAGKGTLWSAYGRVLVEPRSEAMRPVDLGHVLSRVPVLRCRAEEGAGGIDRFRDGDIAEIRRHGLDFLLQFAFGRLGGEILALPRYGVWAFRHGDAEKYPGGPPGFWEIYRGDPVTGAALERLTGPPGAGVALRRGFFRTAAHSYVRNLDRVQLGSADFAARVCEDIRRGRAPWLGASPSGAACPGASIPTGWQTARLVLETARNAAAKALARLFRSEQWNVGIVEAPIHAFLAPGPRPPIRWLPRPARSRYLADPFGIRHGAGLTLLAEDFDYRAWKGRIVALESRDGRSFGEPKPVLDLATHLSYPYLLASGGEVYCVPETSEAEEVGLYLATAFPESWRKVATLVDGFRAVDPTLFRHDGRWWLLCMSLDDANLYAWYAPELTGPWRPHAANPLKTDVRSSRPAGTPFVHEGHLYRPAQDCSRTYGGAVVLNRVLELTPEAFVEEPVAVVRPDPDGPCPDGLHTLSAAGDLTLVDGKRRLLVPAAIRHALGAGLRRLARRATARRGPGR